MGGEESGSGSGAAPGPGEAGSGMVEAVRQPLAGPFGPGAGLGGDPFQAALGVSLPLAFADAPEARPGP